MPPIGADLTVVREHAPAHLVETGGNANSPARKGVGVREGDEERIEMAHGSNNRRVCRAAQSEAALPSSGSIYQPIGLRRFHLVRAGAAPALGTWLLTVGPAASWPLTRQLHHAILHFLYLSLQLGVRVLPLRHEPTVIVQCLLLVAFLFVEFAEPPVGVRQIPSVGEYPAEAAR